MSKHKFISGLEVAGLYAIILLMCVIVILPLMWTLGSSVTQGTSLVGSSALPQHPTLEHFKWLFTSPESKYLLWYKNSVVVGFFTFTIGISVTAVTAYAFSRFRFIGRRNSLYTFMVLQMFPSMMAMVAIYVLLMVVGLVNTLAGLVVIYVGGSIPANTWLLKGYYDTISTELDDAARCDGAGHFRVFFTILLPLAKPMLAIVSLGYFMAPFMDFILPKIILRDEDKYTLAVGLFQFVNNQFSNNFTRFSAGMILVAVPISLVFMFLQRYLIAGLTAGGTKG